MNEYIATRYDLFVKDLETIVNIDSGSYHCAGLEQVAQFFETRFSKLQWHTHIHHFIEEYGACFEASNVAPTSAETEYDLLCIGHMDTVFQEGTVRERPFSLHGNRAMGPGVTDMKSGLVAVLHIIETLQHVGLTEKLNICVAFNGDEEVGSRSSRTWIENLARKSKRAFIFEPGRPNGEYVIQRKGVGMYQVGCYGKSAHAGVEPEKGVNAIIELAHQVLKIDQYENVEAGTTVNVDVISGGSKTNVIPDLATASIDVRVATLKEAARVDALFQQLPDKTTVPGVTVEVRGGINRPAMEPSDATWALWNKITEIGTRLGIEMKLLASGGGSDGNFTSALGVPTIDALGPIGGLVHGPDEYLDLDSIVPKLQLVCQVCQMLAEEKTVSA